MRALEFVFSSTIVIGAASVAGLAFLIGCLCSNSNSSEEERKEVRNQFEDVVKSNKSKIKDKIREPIKNSLYRGLPPKKTIRYYRNKKLQQFRIEKKKLIQKREKQYQEKQSTMERLMS